MLPKNILPPKPPKGDNVTMEDVTKWINAWSEFFGRTYEQIRKQFDEMDKVSVRGDDGKEIHGFFSQPTDMKP